MRSPTLASVAQQLCLTIHTFPIRTPALQAAVDGTVADASEDHDVVILAFDTVVTHVVFVQPQAFLLIGHNEIGNRTTVVAHYSQMAVHVVAQPKRGPERIVIEFRVAQK